ncbi:magnesium-translocating P-type ATPase [Chondromyces crocatus]|uniref:Magnesium-transporting ATPase, P-type 1 n=1 Tax=Chondromyces crocatus TaxID=52 RepID=A0A0K1EDR6_CHOCO|nr:magnesium-translocating P-type ATPase [Chondromyces crocatus]AKT38827.1 magnesium-transporting ATPase [Chondromyces crocatus]
MECDPHRLCSLPLTEMLGRLGASPRGLTSDEARQRLARSGPNEPTGAKREGMVLQVLRRFANPLMGILLLASLVSAVLGDLANAALIVIMVALSVALDAFQTRRSHHAAERLRTQVAPTATALRDGSFQEIPRRDLVPGDVLKLTAGALVPADARLLEARDLHVQQAALTGESLPVEKQPDPGARQATNPVEMTHAVFIGSSVVSGTATAVVFATGADTAFGEIAHTLSKRPPPTEFERGTAQFGMFILRVVFFLVLFIVAVNAALRRDPLETLLFAVALAVGLTPEFLPMITTVTLAQGAVRMAREKVIVKNLAAIQNLGNIDVLCTDKTGTLTTGEMVLDAHLDPFGEPSERPLLLAYLNSYFESGVDNPLDEALLRRAKVNPLDAAVLRHEHPDIDGFAKIDEMPFDFERRRVSVVVERGGERLLVSKGAPEHILAVTTSFEHGGEVRPLEPEPRARCEATFRALSEQGFRVLAVAYRRVSSKPVYDREDERDLTLAGLLAFIDPPVSDAAELVGALREAGVSLKILTGDNELVAAHLCAQIQLDAGDIVVGAAIDRLDEPTLSHLVERTQVFARVSPAQKHRILRAFKARGHVVGYMGDGINDAPSLHAADVGISVAGAVDVAREAAEIVLLERSLRVLRSGILEGRKAFGNVMKYLLMGTSSNFGNMISMAGASLFLPFLPMRPTQILLNNFLYDLAQITIPTDNVDPSFVRRPRRWDIALIRRFMLFIGPLSSIYDFLTFYVLLRVFAAPAPLFHTGWFIESLATQTLVIFVIRTMGSSIESRPSRALTATTLGVVAVALALPYTPVAAPLGFVPMPPTFFLFLVGATLTYLALVEVVKRALFRRVFAEPPSPSRAA